MCDLRSRWTTGGARECRNAMAAATSSAWVRVRNRVRVRVRVGVSHDVRVRVRVRFNPNRECHRDGVPPLELRRVLVQPLVE